MRAATVNFLKSSIYLNTNNLYHILEYGNMRMLELIKNPSYLPGFIIAIAILGIFLFKTIRIFFREGVFRHIRDDWTDRLPYRIHYNKYRGLSRPSYVLICCIYYSIKTLFLFIFALDFYFLKFLFWDIWKWLYEFDIREWHKDFFLDSSSEELEEEDFSDNEDCVENKFTKASHIYSVKQNENVTSKNIAEQEFNITYLWHNGTEEMWKNALGTYWDSFNDEQYRLEKELEVIDVNEVLAFSANDFYSFLYNQYFPWKFTNKLFLSRNRKHLEKYLLNNEMNRLSLIQKRLANLNFADIKESLAVASSIRGLGTAGASGLLTILYPEYFGTVDKFVVFSLLKIEGLQQQSVISCMNPEALTLNDGAALIEIMREKSAELNKRFNTDFWTPRKIDMILWATREY